MLQLQTAFHVEQRQPRACVGKRVAREIAYFQLLLCAGERGHCLFWPTQLVIGTAHAQFVSKCQREPAISLKPFERFESSRITDIAKSIDEHRLLGFGYEANTK